MNNLRNILIAILLSGRVCGAVSGDGNVIAEKRTVTEFRQLTINGPFKIVFSDDAKSDFLIKIETDKNLQQYVTVTQIGLCVFVNIQPGVNIEKFTKMILYVDNRDIHALTINSNSREKSEFSMNACNITLRITGSIPISIRVKTEKLIAEINNEMTTKLSGDAKEVDIIDNGTGAVEAYDVINSLLRVKNKSIAAVEVYSANDFKIDNSGSGYIYYKGEGTVSELKESIKGTVCREEYKTTVIIAPVKQDVPLIRKETRGFNTDSLFQVMMERDQRHRKVKLDDTIHCALDDAENFICLKWYLKKYGYPKISIDTLMTMFPTLFMHIDNYENFMQIRGILLQAMKDGKLQPNTYAYSYDRSMIGDDRNKSVTSHHRPCYFYFLPGSEWDKQYKPTPKELEEVNKQREIINLPPYPGLLNGKYF